MGRNVDLPGQAGYLREKVLPFQTCKRWCIVRGWQAIKWMEDNFCTRGLSLVVVTHDRAFMEAVCTSVLEMEAGEVHMHSFGGPGSYARFREVGFT